MGHARAGLGGVVMGTGITAMHYIGMAAMRLPAMCRYSMPLVILSGVLAILISRIALFLTFGLRDEKRATARKKLSAAILMGAAIPISHYTGMAADTFIPMATESRLTHAVEISLLGGVAIGILTAVRGGINGSHYRRGERVPVAVEPALRHTSTSASNTLNARVRRSFFPARAISP